MSEWVYQGVSLSGSLDDIQKAVEQALAAGSLTEDERAVWLAAMPALLSQDLPDELVEQISDLKVQYDL